MTLPKLAAYQRAELSKLISCLEAAARGLIPTAVEHTADRWPPEDVERRHTAEALVKHRADLMRLRSAIKDAFGVDLET